MVYLDADIQVYSNIDHLFDLDKGKFHAAMDCFCEKTWSHTPQYKIGYCQQCPDEVAWPTAELGPPPALYFNAGMFVHEPSMATAKALIDTLRVTPPTPFAEQVSSDRCVTPTRPVGLASARSILFWQHTCMLTLCSRFLCRTF